MEGVELEPNNVHSDVMKKTAKLHEELARFPPGQAGPLPNDLAIQADRATNIHVGLTESKAYWTAYDERMKQLVASEQPVYADYSFVALESCTSDPLPDELKEALSSLASSSAASIALLTTRRLLGASEPTEGTLQHAYMKYLQPALDLHLESEEDRRAFRPNDVKWLCKPGTRQATPLWDRQAGSVGDLVLVMVNPEDNSDSGYRNWDIAVIRDPLGDPTRKPGLRDTAEGKQVSVICAES